MDSGFVAILTLVICVTLVLIAIPTLIVINRRIKRCTAAVDGTYVGDARHGTDNAYYWPIVRYVVDGVTYETEANYAEGFKSQPVGSPVEVHYDPADVTYAWASMTDGFGQRTVMRVLLWAGVAGCVLAGGFLLRLFL